MKTNNAGLDIIKRSEGWRAKAYRCPAHVLTIGYGHTDSAGKPKVKPGMVISRAAGERILKRDLGKYERIVSKAVKAPVNANQFSAMVSLCYNIGAGSFRRSRVARLTNKRDYEGAAKAFAGWNKGGGRVLRGLVTRRAEEAALYRTKVGQKLVLNDKAPSVKPAVMADGILIHGENGPEVAALQENLKILAMYEGQVDGQFGHGTQAAVLQFQRTYDLDDDGKAGPVTLAEIKAKVENVTAAHHGKIVARKIIIDADKAPHLSTTNIAAGLSGVAGATAAAKQVADNVSDIASAAPWAVAALVVVGGAFWVIRERHRKAKMARQARKRI